MAAGDHLFLYRSFNGLPFVHHGIDCGDGTVIHYQGKLRDSTVTRVYLEHFVGETIYVKEYGKSDPPEIVIARAESRLGENGYNVFGNNCEHFAHWCKTGQPHSAQIRNMQVAVTGLAGIGVGTVATRLMVKSFRLGSGALGIGGLMSGLAIDLAMEQLLADDEYLPEEERRLRKNVRSAGQVGTLVGGMAGGVAAGLMGGFVGLAASVATPAILGVGVAAGAYYLLQDDDSEEEKNLLDS
jgi:Lecithin retinol acyltransferase